MNIILSTGWNDVSWHNPGVVTPHLGNLAESGIILDQSYVQPICSPTRSALMSGKYPFTIGRQVLYIELNILRSFVFDSCFYVDILTLYCICKIVSDTKINFLNKYMNHHNEILDLLNYFFSIFSIVWYGHLSQRVLHWMSQLCLSYLRIWAILLTLLASKFFWNYFKFY